MLALFHYIFMLCKTMWYAFELDDEHLIIYTDITLLHRIIYNDFGLQ